MPLDMPLTNAKKYILSSASTAFTRQTGLKLDLARGKLVLSTTTPEATLEFEPLVLEGGQFAASAMLALAGKTEKPTELLMVTRQLPAEKAEQFRERGVQFLDEAGNAYINTPPFYIFIKGNKVAGDTKAPAIGRTFKQTGLRVLFALLCNPGLENQPYRTIADKTNGELGYEGAKLAGVLAGDGGWSRSDYPLD